MNAEDLKRQIAELRYTLLELSHAVDEAEHQSVHHLAGEISIQHINVQMDTVRFSGQALADQRRRHARRHLTVAVG